MALQNVQVANATKAAVTVGANTVPADGLEAFQIDDAGTDAWGWLHAGCAIVPQSTIVQQQETGFLIYTSTMEETEGV
jgi:hypothetical protein